jgi:ribosomal protein S18 acetylase RimI-like enzyme
MEIILRPILFSDLPQIVSLYKAVAQNSRGIARSISEINDQYVAALWEGISTGGLGFVAVAEHKIVGEIHATQKGIQIFDHLLSYLTIGIHPDYQNKGLGKKLFTNFLTNVQRERKDIYRVELESRASNIAGIKLYERMGFVMEGRMINQTRNADGIHEDGVMYAWFNPYYDSPL